MIVTYFHHHELYLAYMQCPEDLAATFAENEINGSESTKKRYAKL